MFWSGDREKPGESRERPGDPPGISREKRERFSRKTKQQAETIKKLRIVSKTLSYVR